MAASSNLLQVYKRVPLEFKLSYHLRDKSKHDITFKEGNKKIKLNSTGELYNSSDYSIMSFSSVKNIRNMYNIRNIKYNYIIDGVLYSIKKHTSYIIPVYRHDGWLYCIKYINDNLCIFYTMRVPISLNFIDEMSSNVDILIDLCIKYKYVKSRILYLFNKK